MPEASLILLDPLHCVIDVYNIIRQCGKLVAFLAYEDSGIFCKTFCKIGRLND